MSTLEDRIVQALEVIGADVAALQRASGGNGWAVYSVPHLKFLGNSSSDPNTLDFYETGTFSPIIYGANNPGVSNYLFNVGYYTRIGNYVAFSIRMHIDSISGATGRAIIGPLPFIVGNADLGMRGGCHAVFWANMKAPVAQFSGVPSGNSIPLFVDNLHVTTSLSLDITSFFQSGVSFYMYGHYFTND